MRLVAVLLALAAVALSACGGGGGDDVQELYGVYRAADDERSDAESRLRRAFSAIAAAAERRDRFSVLAAIDEGRSAAKEIDRLLGRELEAAMSLVAFEEVTEDAGRLQKGLEQTRQGLGLVVRQLEIGALDPFLDREENASEVNRLAREATELTVDGELAIRRADRAIAVSLGIDPRPDPLLEAPGATAP